MTARVCEHAGCNESLQDRHPSARYCSPEHRAAAWKARTHYGRHDVVAVRSHVTEPLPDIDAPQARIVLRALRDSGGRGVTTRELRHSGIGNPSERVRELEADGWVITHTGECSKRTRWTRYRLVGRGSEREQVAA